MDVEKSNKVKGLSPEKLKAIEKFYHQSKCRYHVRFGIIYSSK